jgi:hypothetical protein
MGSVLKQQHKEQQALDRRPWIYGSLDASFLLFYLLLVTIIIPSRHTGGLLLQWFLVGAMAMACGGMFYRSRWGWRLAVAGCALLLLSEFVLLVLVLVSASYLAGVYGSFGQAASALALVVAALSIQLVALLPAFQLKYLLTRAGRRAYQATATA